MLKAIHYNQIMQIGKTLFSLINDILNNIGTALNFLAIFKSDDTHAKQIIVLKHITF